MTKKNSWNRRVLHKDNRHILLKQETEVNFLKWQNQFWKMRQNARVSLSWKMDSEGIKKYLHFNKDILECPVCYATIKQTPIYQCRNGHVVCENCRPRLTTCPTCRDEPIYLNEIGNLRKLSKAWRKSKSKPWVVVVDATTVELITNVDASEFKWEQ